MSLPFSKTLFCSLVLGTASAQDFPPDIHKFFETNCIKCHGPKKQKGSVRLDDLPSEIVDGAAAQRWQDVLDVLNLSEMPPEDEDQPSKEALANTLEQLTSGITSARKRLTDSGGEIVIRRLNSREYANTIKDLFGIAVPIDSLPEDETLEGFDNLGQAQSFSSLHLDRYLSLGEKVINLTLKKETANAKTARTDYGNKDHKMSDAQKKSLGRIEKNLKAATKRNQSKDPEKNQVVKVGMREKQLLTEYIALPEGETGAVIPFKGINASIKKEISDIPGTYKVRVRCGSADGKRHEDLHLQVERIVFNSKVAQATDWYQVTGTIKEPETIEFLFEVDNIRVNSIELSRRDGRTSKQEEVSEVRGYQSQFNKILHLWNDDRPDIWIDWLEIEGPLPAAEAPLSAKNMFLGKDPKKLSEQDVRPILENFAFHANRRLQPETTVIDALETVYKSSRGHGKPVKDALTDTLRIVLASPSFLWLYEPSPENSPPRNLTERELAIRLSYFLWSSPPDEELYNLAMDKRLGDPKILAAQIDRMLADPRSNAFVETFLTAWLELDRFDLIDSSVVANKTYDAAAKSQTRQETIAFFNYLLQKDLPIQNLISSDFAVLNALTAAFYGIPDVTGDEFREVKLPPKSIRGGLLGQSAILTLTGTGERTSPVERGVYTLRKILNRPPPPAPANVPMLDEESIGSQSMRESLAAHMTTAQCASCHRRIDPLGFSLENFDPVGLWRETVPSSDGETSFPIDTAGFMPDGKTKFDNFLEMRELLTAQSDPFLNGLTEHLMTYALGRTIGFTDRDTLDSITKKTAGENYGLRSLIHNIILSKAFLSK